MIYFFLVGDAVKIGCTHRSIRNRMSSMRGATHNEVNLICSIPGSFDDEAFHHNAWSHLRISGEWFKSDPDLLLWCRGIGVSPMDADDGPSTKAPQSDTKVSNVRVRNKVYNMVKTQCGHSGRTISSEMACLIEDGLKWRKLPRIKRHHSREEE